MKKVSVFAGIFLSSLFISLTVFAQAPAKPEKAPTTTTGSTDKAVIKNSKSCCSGNYDAKSGKCTNFVDKNGDGLCDNCKMDPTKCKESGMGKCQGAGCCQGQAKGKSSCVHSGNGHPAKCMETCKDKPQQPAEPEKAK
jgi:hypothetical protein